MTLAARIPSPLSIDAFDAFELERPLSERWELLEGEPRLMTGGTERHSVITGNILLALRAKLRGKPCRALGPDMQVQNRERDFVAYPDVVVNGTPGSDSRTRLDAPVIVVEVLSPSTSHIDQGAKFSEYQRIPSIRSILFVHQRERRIECYERQDEGFEESVATGPDAAVELPAIGASFGLDEVYEDIAFTA